MRPVKCPGCGEFFRRDQVAFVQHKNRYWHKSCYETSVQQANKDAEEQRKLEEYIVKLLKLDNINTRIRKQIKDMREEYGYSYSGIQKSLEYFYEVKGNSIEKANNGIGIVPYVYETAKEYYYNIFMAHLQNKDKDVEEFVKKGRVIKIPPPERKVKPVKLVDLDILLEEVIKDGE